MLELTEQAGKLMQRSIRETKRLLVVARRRARGRGAQAKRRQIQGLEVFVQRAERVAEPIRQRMRGERITDRLVSIFDPDARPRQPARRRFLPQTVAELERLGISPREVALDGGFNVGPTSQALAGVDPERTFIAGRHQPGSKRTQRRLARCRPGSEGRISHMKRGYGLRRSRLKDHHGMQTWTGWSILAYNHDTLAIRAS